MTARPPRPLRRGRPLSDHRYLRHLADTGALADAELTLRAPPTPEVWWVLSATPHTEHPRSLSYWNAWDGAVTTLHRCGACQSCGSMTWDSEDGEDPRGAVGMHHLASPLSATEYGATGPDIAACWECRNNDPRTAARLRKLGDTRWTWPATPSAPLAPRLSLHEA
jgi:hypothetical protein